MIRIDRLTFDEGVFMKFLCKPLTGFLAALTLGPPTVFACPQDPGSLAASSVLLARVYVNDPVAQPVTGNLPDKARFLLTSINADSQNGQTGYTVLAATRGSYIIDGIEIDGRRFYDFDIRTNNTWYLPSVLPGGEYVIRYREIADAIDASRDETIRFSVLTPRGGCKLLIR